MAAPFGLPEVDQHLPGSGLTGGALHEVIAASHGDRPAAFGFATDTEFVRHLITEIGVAAVPGSSFFRNPADGHHLVRFTFCKKEETLLAAEQRLKKLRKGVSVGS